MEESVLEEVMILDFVVEVCSVPINVSIELIENVRISMLEILPVLSRPPQFLPLRSLLLIPLTILLLS
jgi:hypothetical protein